MKKKITIISALICGLSLPVMSQTPVEMGREAEREIGVEEPTPHVEALTPDKVDVDTAVGEREVEVSQLPELQDDEDNFPGEAGIEKDEENTNFVSDDPDDLQRELQSLREQVEALAEQNATLRRELDELKKDTTE
jgi:peptidoglycan hydrolase CwlO-like protein